MRNKMADDIQKTVVVGISGASSSGKTTLCHLLKDIFPNLLVIHGDDFFRPQNEIPYKGELQDWDCAEALSLPGMIESLKFVRKTGTILANKRKVSESQKTSSVCPVRKDVISALKNRVTRWTTPGQPGYILRFRKVCLFEGFLLYSRSTSDIWPYLDLKIFIQASESSVKLHRQEHEPYISDEGFWEDPPNYVDRIVWPNYCDEHQWLFESGDVEGKLLDSPDPRCQIMGLGGIDIDLETSLIRIVDLLMKELPRLMKN